MKINPAECDRACRRLLPWLLLLFFGSGFAALVYEVVWLQLLELVIGSSGVSLGILLGTFMGGMCLGSLLLPRHISQSVHPLRVYALLELGIGLCAIIVLFGLPPLAGLYESFYGHGVFARALVAAICLIPPTALMGATLPAAARFVRSTPEGVSWMGFFYGANIAGAVAGCFLSGFVLLRIFDMPVATYAAATLNLLVAAFAMMLSRGSAYAHNSGDVKPASIAQSSGRFFVYLAIALSGLSALGAEVVWTRLLSLLLGATVYTFSIILAVFLFGMGIGSAAGSLMARVSPNPRISLGVCQMLLTGAIAWAAFVISQSLPYWPVNPGIYTGDLGPWFLFQLDILRTAWMVLPAAMLWGASFPLAIAATAASDRDPGRMVGAVYAANTAGAILGSLAFSMVVVPQFGSQWAQRILIIAAAVSGILMLASTVSFKPSGREIGKSSRALVPYSGLAWTIVALLVIAFLVHTVSRIPWVMVAWGRFSANYMAQAEPELISENALKPDVKSPSRWYCTYLGEGMNISVAVTRSAAGARFFHGAGKVQASSQPRDMRLQRMLGHLSVLTCRNPEKVENVLVIACGAGVTAGTFVLYPGVRRIVICDIEPLVPQVVAPMFGRENYHVVDGVSRQNPRIVNGKEVTVVYDDGRHYVRTLPDDVKFDVITSDPVDPWVKGSAALNTIEFYEMCKKHLAPGGVMSLWIPLYESSMASSKSMIATFFRVFKDGMIFSNDEHLEGYDAMLLGRASPAQIDLDRTQQLLNHPEYQPVRQSLEEVGFGRTEDPEHGNVVDLFATFAGQASDLGAWTEKAQINRDKNLRLQYLSGMWLNSYLGTRIFQSILCYYRFPDNIFVGPDLYLNSLKMALAQGGRREIAPPASP